jgi:CxxC-x17-CxxC domain-containing protein
MVNQPIRVFAQPAGRACSASEVVNINFRYFQASKKLKIRTSKMMTGKGFSISLPCRTKTKKTTSKSNSYAAGGPSNIDYGAAPRKTFAVKCSSCGKDTMVPFVPDANRPVYCYDCFREVKQIVKSESS